MNESFLDLAKMQWLTPENARFYRTKNGFAAMEAMIPPVRDDLLESDERTPVKQDLGRVYFHRCFPFETPSEYISVLDKDGREYGMIRSLDEFSDEAKEIILAELERKYLCPTITKINSLKEKLGYSYWKVETDRGDCEFSMRDTYRNIARVGGGRLVITDVDGNRYHIEDVAKLDRKSYKRIELYL